MSLLVAAALVFCFLGHLSSYYATEHYHSLKLHHGCFMVEDVVNSTKMVSWLVMVLASCCFDILIIAVDVIVVIKR